MNRQSANGSSKKITALYLRISREDSNTDESYSIVNQKKLLTDIAKKMKLANIKSYIDDGVTGTKLDRKHFTVMLTDIEKGLVSTVIVKDLSRLSRDKSQANDLIEKFFPHHDIRFISVSEGIDSENGEDEFLGFRTLMNEWYSRDISKKRKLTNVVKDNAKEPLSLPPYGYMKDPDGKGWVVDPEAADIVRRIFDMTLNGKGTEQIAAALSADKVLSPMFYWRSKGLNRGGKVSDRVPYHWNSSTVVKILSMQEYCGDIINLKTYAKSFKLKKRYDNENKSVHRDMHQPLIDRAAWERIQEKRNNKTRKRKANDGEKNMFSGLLVCADCGKNLWYHFNQKNHDITYFNCSNYKGNRGTCNDTHYIRVDFLENVVLQEIRRLTRFASQHETEFAALVMGYSRQTGNDQRQRKQKELYALTARDRELDRILSKCYEDNISGKLNDERFTRLDKQYTLEQKELAEKIKAISTELDKQETKSMTADMFISTVRKYTRAKMLTERLLTEIIERIEVHQSEKVDGVHRQRITIYYNCVGAIEIPATLSLPEISMQTRKGVTVAYQPLQQAV